MADTQELAALKLDLELVINRTEEIGSKVHGVEDKVTTLSAQISRLESLLLADRDKKLARQKEVEDQQRDAEQEEADAAQQRLQGQAQQNAAAAEQQQQQQAEHERGRGHSKPPHWRRRTDAQDPPHYEYPATDNPRDPYQQDDLEREQCYDDLHYAGEAQYQQPHFQPTAGYLPNHTQPTHFPHHLPFQPQPHHPQYPQNPQYPHQNPMPFHQLPHYPPTYNPHPYTHAAPQWQQFYSQPNPPQPIYPLEHTTPNQQIQFQHNNAQNGYARQGDPPDRGNYQRGQRHHELDRDA